MTITATALRHTDGAALKAALSGMRPPGHDASAHHLRRTGPLLPALVAAGAGAGKQATLTATATAHALAGPRRLRRRLLACGIAASLLSIGTDVAAVRLAEGYDVVIQSISELTAVGAPTRPLVVPLNLTYDALMIAFGIGVWTAAGTSRTRRTAAAMIIGNAGVSAVWALFPVHTGAPPSPANVGFGAASMVLFVLAIVCGAVGYRGFVRFYSIATLAAYGGLTAYGLLRARGAAADSPTPIGAQERTMALGYLLWVVVLAVALLRADNEPGLAAGGDARSAVG